MVTTTGISKLVQIRLTLMYPNLLAGIVARESNPMTGIAALTRLHPYHDVYTTKSNVQIPNRISPMALERIIPRLPDGVSARFCPEYKITRRKFIWQANPFL